MAKVAFTKLGLKANQKVEQIEYNDQKIEVKQYLPVNDKLVLISNVINLTYNDNGNNFINPLKIELYALLEIIEAYTNINFTEKQKENPAKIYDLFQDNGLLNQIILAIPKEEYQQLKDSLYRSIEEIYKYHNSVLGILDALSTDYSNLNLDLTQIQEKLKNTENIDLLQQVLSQFG